MSHFGCLTERWLEPCVRVSRRFFRSTDEQDGTGRLGRPDPPCILVPRSRDRCGTRRGRPNLLGERDATGQPREGVEVLRGDPHRVAVAAVTLPSELKCNLERSLAWSPTDAAADVQKIDAVLDALEHSAWAGPGSHGLL